MNNSRSISNYARACSSLTLGGVLLLCACGGGEPSEAERVWSGLAPRGALVGDVLGMATQMYDGTKPSPERDFEIQKLLESGLRRIRISVDWSHVEPAQDQFDWERTDSFVTMLTTAGLQVDGRLSYGVDWARPDGNDSAIKPEDYADYAAHVAAHYCGVIDSWEFWNEENLQRFWKPAPDPERYGAILEATFTAVHAACPSSQVLIGGISCIDQHTFNGGLYYFLNEMHAFHPEIGQYFDALAIHPYTFLQTPSPEASWQEGDREIWPDMPGQVELARSRLADIGAEGKPIWATEWGWPSLIVGQDMQGAFFARGALLAISTGVEALDWYTFWDKEGPSFPPTEDYFGLFTWPGASDGPKEKPAFRVGSTLSRQLGTSRFSGDMRVSLALPDGAEALAFVDDGDSHVTFVGWDSVAGRTTPLTLARPPHTHGYQCSTDEGEPACEPGDAPTVELTLGNHPSYVRFDR